MDIHKDKIKRKFIVALQTNLNLARNQMDDLGKYEVRLLRKTGKTHKRKFLVLAFLRICGDWTGRPKYTLDKYVCAVLR